MTLDSIRNARRQRPDSLGVRAAKMWLQLARWVYTVVTQDGKMRILDT